MGGTAMVRGWLEKSHGDGVAGSGRVVGGGGLP